MKHQLRGYNPGQEVAPMPTPPPLTPEALARRAVACKGWRKMPGMRGAPAGERPARITTFDDSAILHHEGSWWEAVEWDQGLEIAGEWLPDLTDPATLGCLLALERTLYGDPLLRVEGFPDGWRTVRTSKHPYIIGLGPTEAAALVAALEAAP